MRVVFCGSGGFGIPTLRWLARPGGPHEVACVLTQPARPAGRGGKLRPTPLSLAAGGLGLGVTEVEDINDGGCVSQLAGASADVMVVVDFGQKIGPGAREAGRLGTFNLHASLLPALRGAAPINWAIIRGCRATGVTTFRMVQRMDAGEIFARRRTQVGEDETAEELHQRLSVLGVETVEETLAKLAAGQTAGEAQDESKATRAPRLTKADGRIDFAADAAAIRNLIHGTWPWPGGQARYVPAEGKPVDVIIARARALDTAAPAAPGVVLDDLTLAAGTGRLEVGQLRPAGRKLIAWRDFVNGYRVRPGARFTGVQP
jgi:methionyl-tRNA formyltransferase